MPTVFSVWPFRTLYYADTAMADRRAVITSIGPARLVREAAITLYFHFTTLSERKVICPSHHPLELLSQIIQAFLNTSPKRKISERDLL